MSVPSDVQGPPERATLVATGRADVPRGRRLSGSRRKLVLTVHLAAALSLLGASVAMLVGSLYAATRDDPQDAHAIYSLLRLFTFTLDIPLAFIALIAGLTLALTSKWRVFRYWWVTAKLTLFLATITTGITLIGPSIDTMLDVTEAGAPSETISRWRLSLVTAAQVTTLLAAATLGVFKPGGRAHWPGVRGG